MQHHCRCSLFVADGVFFYSCDVLVFFSPTPSSPTAGAIFIPNAPETFKKITFHYYICHCDSISCPI